MKNKIIKWLKIKVKKAGAKGLVCGLSGGIDSAVAAVLIKKAFPANSLFLFMPCKSCPADRKDALLLAKQFKLNLLEIDIEPMYNCFLKILKIKTAAPVLAFANLKPRLRMITLYFYANKLNYLVVGTGNKTELTMGYFTKYGDGGADIMPLGGFLKRQVRKLAKGLNIPEEIINKPPSAGLWEGQTDEAEMGIAYNELDNIITGLENKKTKWLDRKKLDKVRKANAASMHKRRTPEVFKG